MSLCPGIKSVSSLNKNNHIYFMLFIYSPIAILFSMSLFRLAASSCSLCISLAVS